MLTTGLIQLPGIKARIQCGTMQWLSNAEPVAGVAQAEAITARLGQAKEALTT